MNKTKYYYDDKEVYMIKFNSAIQYIKKIKHIEINEIYFTVS